jgi:hypothetical protein
VPLLRLNQSRTGIPLHEIEYVLAKLRWMREQGIWPNGLRYLWTDAPGFRVSDDPPSDELKLAHDAYLHDLKTAWQRGVRKVAVPGAASALSNQMPASDVDDVYRST